MASRHFKYSYFNELPPKTLFFKMSKANTDNINPNDFNGKMINLNNERNKIYFSRRKELKDLIKKVILIWTIILSHFFWHYIIWI